MIVYKYLPPNRTSVLEEGLIRFTQSGALNDPFETTPNMQRSSTHLEGMSCELFFDTLLFCGAILLLANSIDKESAAAGT
jgi:hypothetical protein